MLNFLRKLNTIDDYYSYILFILIKKKTLWKYYLVEHANSSFFYILNILLLFINLIFFIVMHKFSSYLHFSNNIWNYEQPIFRILYTVFIEIYIKTNNKLL